MDKIKFKKLLFDIACSAIACDGNIDEREIRELKYINKSTTYFKDINLSRKLDRFVDNFKVNPRETIKDVINELRGSFLNPVEEMLVLEVALRLIYADVKVDEKEIDFLKSIRACLSIDDDIITQRFGVIDFLINTQENIVVSKDKPVQKDILSSVDMTNLENVYFSIDKKKEKNSGC